MRKTILVFRVSFRCPLKFLARSCNALEKMSWWSNTDWQSWQGWQDSWSQHRQRDPPTTPPKHTTKPEQLPIPQGGNTIVTALPASFSPDTYHFDRTEVNGFKFLKRVAPSNCAVKRQLAGRDPTRIPLHMLSWNGWMNPHARAFSNGRFVSLLFARSIKEASFLAMIQSQVRQANMDLDQVALAFCDSKGQSPPQTLMKIGQELAHGKAGLSYAF